jgi:hypothetical protein
MQYRVGQKVNLWQTEVLPKERLTRVHNSVIVTITEVKTGVPGHWSRTPTSHQSLRGVGDDGRIYEKHWESWPESQTNDFLTQWSPCEHWDWAMPREAVQAYNDFVYFGKQKHNVVDRIVGPDGNDIVPQGDVERCETHDQYYHAGDDGDTKCFVCFLEKIRRTA